MAIWDYELFPSTPPTFPPLATEDTSFRTKAHAFLSNPSPLPAQETPTFAWASASRPPPLRSAPTPAASAPPLSPPPPPGRQRRRRPTHWIRPGTPPPRPPLRRRPAPGGPRCGIWRRRAGSRRTSECRSRRWCRTARGGGSRTRSRRRAPATSPCRCSSARCTAVDTASTRTSTRQGFGWRKHQGIDLQSGKLAINAQVTMLVTRTQIQVMLKNHTNKEILRIVNPLMDGISTCTCACTFGMTTKPAKQHKLPLEASDMQFCRGIWLCPCYLACSLDIDVSFFLFLFPFHSVSYTVLLWFMGFLCSGLFWFV